MVLFGVVLVVLTVVISRWFDDILVGELCLYALLCELAITVSLTNCFTTTDSQLILDCGELFLNFIYLTIQLLFCFDALSGFFFSILTLALVICFYFLVEYFEYDAHATNIILLSALFSQLAFCFFMSFDLFLIVFFWEAISIVSFLLVQHWSHRLCTYKAGLKVFTISQIGDLPFLAFIFFMFNRTQTTNVFELLTLTPLFCFDFLSLGGIQLNLITCLGFLLSFAVFLKAAQFFFYPWLLDAMEAPVPISAQLHSSTLVIIGFYLFYRFQIIYQLSINLSSLFLWMGVCTVVGASVLAFYQIDGKRLLACSTASQLGYIVVALGLGLFEEALILLIFCCCNKAITFVWFGVLMHKASGVSDFRFLTGVCSRFWLGHAGLVVALSNFTIIPGAFSWHAKSLFILGTTPFKPMGAFFGLEVLQLTWFFSSLYLICLYVVLFCKANPGIYLKQPKSASTGLTLFSYCTLRLATIGVSFYIVTVLILISLVNPFTTLSVLLFDSSVFSSNLIGYFSYY